MSHLTYSILVHYHIWHFCKTITSAWSAPTKTNLSFVGLVNPRKMILGGFNMIFCHNLSDQLSSHWQTCLFHVQVNRSEHQQKIGLYAIQLKHLHLPGTLIPFHLTTTDTTVRLALHKYLYSLWKQLLRF